MLIILASEILGKSSCGLLVSTITTSSPSLTDSKSSGSGTPHRSRTKLVSLFSFPKTKGLAFLEVWVFKYHAHKIALPVVSVSGDICPKTFNMISSYTPNLVKSILVYWIVEKLNIRYIMYAWSRTKNQMGR